MTKKGFKIASVLFSVCFLAAMINPAQAATIVKSEDFSDNPVVLNSDLPTLVISFGKEVNNGFIEANIKAIQPQFSFWFGLEQPPFYSDIAFVDYGVEIISDNWRGSPQNDFFYNTTPITSETWVKIIYSWSYDLNTRHGQQCLEVPNNPVYCSNTDFPIPFDNVAIGNPAEEDLLIKNYAVYSNTDTIISNTDTIIPVAAIVAPLSQAPSVLFNDLLPLIVLIIGVPFGFWVITKVVALAKKSFSR